MNYYVHNLETVNARIFKKKHFQFDYIEPDSFEKMQNSNNLSVIGCLKLKEIEKEAATDTVVISSGITDHYFMLMPPDKMKHLNRKHLIGYVMVSTDTYVAVYEHSILIPLLLSMAFLAVFCAIIF
ncbi:MAG: hypothetical protein HFI54_14360 [Lachnospiraceae bacterium]|nr:hypothetical protein [Lachnospiraceae bacterium]